MIPFSPPRIDEKIVEAVSDTLRTGWISTGPKTKLFEKEITKFCGSKMTHCVSSATAGMEISLRWFGVKPGDEVIVPAYTYCATANVVTHLGATPVMVDTNSEDFNISVEAIKAKITDKTKAIIPVDIGGYPCQYDEILKLVESHKDLFNPETKEQEKLGRILVLADAAHSFGAHYQGKRSGAIADISVFSFHAVKNLTTAEGGAITFNLPENFDTDVIYKELCIKTLHGQSKDALAKTQKGGWKYDVIEAGYKYNMTDIQASIGLVEIERYENDTLKRRKRIFDMYNSFFKTKDWAILPPEEKGGTKTSYHLYQLRIDGISEQKRDAIIQTIFDQEVSVNVHFQPLPLLSFYKNQGYNMNDYPQAYQNYAHEISLPIYYNLTDEQVGTVIKAVEHAVEKHL